MILKALSCRARVHFPSSEARLKHAGRLQQKEALNHAITHILQHLDVSLCVEDIAAVCHLSPRTLTRRFSEETQMTCGQFIHRARMLRAMELLAERSEAPVIEIALEVGFESLSAFTSAFRTFTQETPAAYRKRFGVR